jgi:hypothetical protein
MYICTYVHYTIHIILYIYYLQIPSWNETLNHLGYPLVDTARVAQAQHLHTPEHEKKTENSSQKKSKKGLT